MRYTAKINCRTYRYLKKKRENLDYDIRVNNRYYEEIL